MRDIMDRGSVGMVCSFAFLFYLFALERMGTRLGWSTQYSPDPDMEATFSTESKTFSANVKCPTALSSAATAINEICRMSSGWLFQSEGCDQALATLIDVLSESCITDD
jgi:hypothetical protein